MSRIISTRSNEHLLIVVWFSDPRPQMHSIPADTGIDGKKITWVDILCEETLKHMSEWMAVRVRTRMVMSKLKKSMIRLISKLLVWTKKRSIWNSEPSSASERCSAGLAHPQSLSPYCKRVSDKLSPSKSTARLSSMSPCLSTEWLGPSTVCLLDYAFEDKDSLVVRHTCLTATVQTGWARLYSTKRKVGIKEMHITFFSTFCVHLCWTLYYVIETHHRDKAEPKRACLDKAWY